MPDHRSQACPWVPSSDVFSYAHANHCQTEDKPTCRLPILPQTEPTTPASPPPPPMTEEAREAAKEAKKEAANEDQTEAEKHEEQHKADAEAKVKLLDQLRERRKEVERLMAKRRAEREGISVEVCCLPFQLWTIRTLLLQTLCRNAGSELSMLSNGDSHTSWICNSKGTASSSINAIESYLH